MAGTVSALRPEAEEFAAQRRVDQKALELRLLGSVTQALANRARADWYQPILDAVRAAYDGMSGGHGDRVDRDRFLTDVATTLAKTSDPPQEASADRIAVWLATAILNATAINHPDNVLLEWVTMHDEHVREAHRHTDGQRREPGQPYSVDGVPMLFPGDPSAPIDLWINCRCALRPVVGPTTAAAFTAVNQEDAMTETIEAPVITDPSEPVTQHAIPWHGVLAPEGVWSGDGRRFKQGALSLADLPLPLTWQKVSDDGHKGSVVVAKIERAARVGNEMRATGHFLMTPEADEAIGLVAQFGRFGVSVDADDAEFDFADEGTGKIEFTNARIRSASMVSIPAFAEAFVSLGSGPSDFMPKCDPMDPKGECYDPAAVAPPIAEPGRTLAEEMAEVSNKPWSNFTQADYTPEQWKAATILHRDPSPIPKSNHSLPVREPSGTLNRNGVHAAAAALAGARGGVNATDAQKAAARSTLRGLYRQIGDELPDSLKASDGTESFDRGPGWITNPVATRRIHDYWTVPGNEGYLKIGWGTPGDFDRCKVEIGQEIGEEDPATVARYMNQICAQWHHDATGFWPGHAPAEIGHSAVPESFEADPAPALSLVASGGWCAPSDWFRDPKFTALTPLMVTDDGQVLGHLAGWATCHTGFPGVCVAPPHSVSGYAHFLTGYVVCDDGSQVPVGQVTLSENMQAGHADHRLGMRAAIEHYDNTCVAVADVTCGEDEFGIWLAGAMRPGVTEEQVHVLRASGLSGDWREDAFGNMEMIAALAVNAQGFPVPRVGIAAGIQVSLVAAGAVLPSEPERFTLDALATAVEGVIVTRQANRLAMSALASRVWGSEHPANGGPSANKRAMMALADRFTTVKTDEGGQ